MTRATAAFAVLMAALWTVSGAARQALYESKPVTVTATVEAIDKAARKVTLKMADGRSEEVQAPPEVEGFNSIKVGDQVSATYLEATAVRVAKPGDAPPPSTPTTVTERKDRKPGSETRRDQTFRVTITAIDPKTPSLSVKGARGLSVMKVSDPKQLQSLKVGDTVDVTYYESLLIRVTRPPSKD